jgi:hypothetical protein
VSGLIGTGEWETVRTAGLGNWQDWIVDPFATEEQFLSDLSGIDWVGIYINRNTAIQQFYGIDNFSLMIPEPAQMIMLAFSLLAVWIAVRRKQGRESVQLQ